MQINQAMYVFINLLVIGVKKIRFIFILLTKKGQTHRLQSLGVMGSDPFRIIYKFSEYQKSESHYLLDRYKMTSPLQSIHQKSLKKVCWNG